MAGFASFENIDRVWAVANVGAQISAATRHENMRRLMRTEPPDSRENGATHRLPGSRTHGTARMGTEYSALALGAGLRRSRLGVERGSGWCGETGTPSPDLR